MKLSELLEDSKNYPIPLREVFNKYLEFQTTYLKLHGEDVDQNIMENYCFAKTERWIKEQFALRLGSNNYKLR